MDSLPNDEFNFASRVNVARELFSTPPKPGSSWPSVHIGTSRPAILSRTRQNIHAVRLRINIVSGFLPGCRNQQRHVQTRIVHQWVFVPNSAAFKHLPVIRCENEVRVVKNTGGSQLIEKLTKLKIHICHIGIVQQSCILNRCEGEADPPMGVSASSAD